MTIATVSPSDELPSFLWPAETIAFRIAAGLGLASLALLWARRGHAGTWLALAGFLIGLPLPAFAGYVYHLDFVAVAKDGTPASGPLWEALLIPSLPPAANAILAVIHHWRRAFACDLRGNPSLQPRTRR